MRRSPPTILDVARGANVSVGTVSNVLNGKVGVSDKRRQRVEKAIKELGYSRNLLAQGLRGRRSPMVGVCVPHTTVAYFAALVDAFEEVASDRGFRIIQVLTRQDPVQEMDRVQALLHYNVGGLILIPSMQPERTLKLLAESGTPCVIVDRPTKSGLLDEVTFDNRGAMFEAARRLIALGHRRIALIVRQPKLATTMLRIEGLRAAAAEAPGQVSTQIIVCDRDEIVLTGLLAAEFQKSDPPTAFVAASSVIAGWLLRALRALGVRYPTDVSVLAFDEPEWADLVTPQLSVVRQPTLEIARSAWKLLIRRMAEESAPVRKIELKADIVLRDSVGPLLPRTVLAAEPSAKRAGRKERV